MVQAEKFGARIAVPREATGLAATARRTSSPSPMARRSSPAASSWPWAPATACSVCRARPNSGEERLLRRHRGRGQACQGLDVAVVGGGNSAGQAALFLSDRAHQVFLVARCDDLGSDMSRYLVDRIRQTANIEPVIQHQVHELLGEDELERDHRRTQDLRRAQAPRHRRASSSLSAPTRRLPGCRARSSSISKGFISTGLPCKSAPAWQGAARDPLLFETSLPGVFAVGDVRSGAIRRTASAVGEGSMAVRLCHAYLAEIRGAGVMG